MPTFYSPSHNGFFHREVAGERMPADVVLIDDKEHQQLLTLQAQGKRIQSGPGGQPIAVDRIPTAADLQRQRVAKAKAALAASDADVLECVENAQPVTPALAGYRKALRAVIAGTSDVLPRLLLALLCLCVPAALFAQTSTPNLGLQLPGHGAQNWNLPLNANFTQIDLLLSGQAPLPALQVTGNVTAANLVTTGSYQGAWSSATTYSLGQTVLYNSTIYLSRINANLNQNPGTVTSAWASYLPLGSSGGGPTPVDIVASYVGQPGAGATVFLMTFNRPMTIAANFAGSNVTCGTNPTAPASYAVLKNGTAAGTITLSTACALSGTTSGTLSFNAGDRMAITAPASADSTLSDVALSVAATR